MKQLGRFVYENNGGIVSIPLSGRSEVLVKKGERVKRGDPIIKSNYKRVIQSYFLPKELGIVISKAPEYIARLNGEYITKGEVIAEKLSAGGLMVKKVISTVEGIVSLDRVESGYVDILAQSEQMVISSDFSGEIESIVTSKAINIKTNSLVIDLISVNKSPSDEYENLYSGEFELIGDGSSVYTTKDLKEDYGNKIVFAGRFMYPQLLLELYARGALFVLTYSMDFDEYQQIEQSGVGIIGGFGNISYDQYFQKTIKSMNDVQCVVSCKNRQIVFPQMGQFVFSSPSQPTSWIVDGIKVNMKVIVRDVDGLNRIGKVIDLVDNDFATVKFEDGSNRLIPNAILSPIYL